MAIRNDRNLDSLYDLTPAKKAVAQRIIDIGIQLGASQRDIAIALAAAKRESDLTNDKTPDEYGSVGIFQDRADDAPGTYLHGGPPHGYGTMAHITAGDGDQSIYNFYLGPQVKGTGEGLNAGLLAQKDRDKLDWATAAYKTQGFAKDNLPYYGEHSENGKFALAALQGLIDGINSSGVATVPQTGGSLYDRYDNGTLVAPRSDGFRPPSVRADAKGYTPPPPGTPPPAAPAPTVRATAMPTAHSTPSPIAAIPTGAKIAGSSIGRVAQEIGQGIAGIPSDAVNVASTIGHQVGDVAQGIGHAVSGIAHSVGSVFSGGAGSKNEGPASQFKPTAPVGTPSPQPGPSPHVDDAVSPIGRPVSDWAVHGIDWGQVPAGAKVVESVTPDAPAIHSPRQVSMYPEDFKQFLPAMSIEEFHAGGGPALPANGLAPTPSSAPLEALGVDSNNLRDAIAVQANKWLGIDYQWGGKNRANGGIDCSGLVMGLLRAVGIHVGSPDEMNAAALGELGPLTKTPQVGDLVAWDEGNSFNHNGRGADHIAIYLGNGYIVEAPRTGVKSRIRKLGESFDTKNRMWFIDMTKYEGKGTVPPEHLPTHEIKPQTVMPIEAVKDVGHMLKSAATTALHATEKIPGIGGVIKAGADAADAFTQMSEHALGAAAGKVAGSAEDAVEGLANAGVDLGGAALSGLASAAHGVGKGLENAIGAAVPDSVLHGIDNFASSHSLSAVPAAAARVVGHDLGAVGNAIGDVASAYGHRVADSFSDVAHDPVGSVVDAAGAVAGLAKNPLHLLTGAPQRFRMLPSGEVVREVVNDALTTTGRKITGIGKIPSYALADGIAKGVEHFIPFFDRPAHEPPGLAQIADAVGGVKNFAEQGAGVLGHALGDVAGGIGHAIGGLFGGGGGGAGPERVVAADHMISPAEAQRQQEILAQYEAAQAADRGLANRVRGQVPPGNVGTPAQGYAPPLRNMYNPGAGYYLTAPIRGAEEAVHGLASAAQNAGNAAVSAGHAVGNVLSHVPGLGFMHHGGPSPAAQQAAAAWQADYGLANRAAAIADQRYGEMADQRAAAEQADRGLANRANDIYAQTAPPVFQTPPAKTLPRTGGGVGVTSKAKAGTQQFVSSPQILGQTAMKTATPEQVMQFGGVQNIRQLEAQQAAATQVQQQQAQAAAQAAMRADKAAGYGGTSSTAQQAAAAAAAKAASDYLARMHAANAAAAAATPSFAGTTTRTSSVPMYGSTPVKVGNTGAHSVASTPSYAMTPSQQYQQQYQQQYNFNQFYNGGGSSYAVPTAYNPGPYDPATATQQQAPQFRSDAMGVYYTSGGGYISPESVATQMLPPGYRSDAYDTYRNQVANNPATYTQMQAPSVRSDAYNSYYG